MGVIDLPVFMDNGGSFPASTFRSVVRTANPVDGVLGVNELKVAQRAAGANYSVDIAIGRGIVPEMNTDNRAYLVNHTGNVYNLPMNSPPGSNSRYDLVYLEVRDQTVSGSINDARFNFLEGTASTSPVWPTVPAQSIPLAMVLRTAGAGSITTGNIVDVRTVTDASGRLAEVFVDGSYVYNGETAGAAKRVNNSLYNEFWTPASGRVSIEVSLLMGCINVPASSTVMGAHLVLLDDAGNVYSGTQQAMIGTDSSGNGTSRLYYKQTITGLGPGLRQKIYPYFFRGVGGGEAWVEYGGNYGGHMSMRTVREVV